MRREHFLSPTDSNSTPQQAIWFDTETDQIQIDSVTVEHVLTFGWAAYSRILPSGKWRKPVYIRFTTAAEFWDWAVSMHRPKTRLYMFCHNTSFDLPVLDCFTALPNRGYELKTAVIDAPPTILKWRNPMGTIVILDTLNIWRMPLEQVAESIGMKKLPFPKKSDSVEVWDRYGKNDVDIIMEACIQWWRFLVDHDMGGFANTLAGQALKTYRHKHLRTRILIDDNEQALALSRAAYMGARTECHYIGKLEQDMVLLDINSMYPYVMKKHLYPAILKGYTRHATVADIDEWLNELCITARVTINTDEAIYPYATESKLLFPVGRFECCLCTPELEIAIERGHIEKVHEVALYYPDDLFSSFVDEFYEARLEYIEAGNKAEANRFKNILTNLYGKFGQHGIVYKEQDTIQDLTARKWIEIDADTGDAVNWRQFGGLVQRQMSDRESRDSHPAIAAHVTAYGRVLLFDYNERAGNGNVFYNDTDSLVCNLAGRDNLRDVMGDKTLGMLKQELAFDYAEIYGPKDYVFGNRSKTKGVKKSAVWLDRHTVEQERWSSLKGLINTGHISRPTTTTFRKHLKREYDKGIVQPDGCVKPIRL